MKNEPFFAFTAAIVFAGVIASFASPASAPVARPLAPANSISAVVVTPVAPVALVALVAPSDANPVAAPAIHPRHGHRRAVEKS